MTLSKPLARIFNQDYESHFKKALVKKFGAESYAEVSTLLQKLGLPEPEHYSEFFTGRTGVLIFINRYGVVVRIELPENPKEGINRVNDSAFILKPLATIDLKFAVVEICPGYHIGASDKDVQFLHRALNAEGINLTDGIPRNIGFSPFKTVEFPKGRPTLIDRISVNFLTENIAEIKAALEKQPPITEDIEYAPLVDAFKDAWPEISSMPNAERMRAFWQMCADFKSEGKLVAGWINRQEKSPAFGIGDNYEKKFPVSLNQKLLTRIFRA